MWPWRQIPPRVDLEVWFSLLYFRMFCFWEFGVLCYAPAFFAFGSPVYFIILQHTLLLRARYTLLYFIIHHLRFRFTSLYHSTLYLLARYTLLWLSILYLLARYTLSWHSILYLLGRYTLLYPAYFTCLPGILYHDTAYFAQPGILHYTPANFTCEP